MVGGAPHREGAARRGRLQAQARHDEGLPPAQPGISRQVEASAPSVSHCPTSIPQPLALILSLPHAGQRQKQSRDNPAVPPTEPRPRTRNGPRHRGIAPAWPQGLQGSSPGTPTALGGFSGSRGPEPCSRLSCLGGQQPWMRWHTFCQPHQCPTPVTHSTAQGSRDVQGVPGNDGGCLPASGLAQKKPLPELARDVLGEEIQPANPISSD